MGILQTASIREGFNCIVKNVAKIFRCVKLVEGDVAQEQGARVHDATIQD